MAYPKTRPDAAGVPASPDLPAVERRVLDYWAADKTFEAVGRRARRPGANGANEYVFYDGPPFANGLPHYGHLLTGYVKDVVPRYQTMRGRAGRAPVRLGLPRPAGRGRGGEAARHHHQGARSSTLGVDKFNEACRDVGAALHQGLGAVRHPPGPLGRLRQRLQDARPGLHGERHVGVQDPARQGSGLRGLPGAGVLLAVRDAAVQHRDPDGRRLPGPAGPGADRVVPAGRRGEKIAVWTTTPWTLPSNLALAVGPDIEYAVLEKDGEKVRPSARPALAAYAKELEGCDAGRHGARRASWSGAGTRRCSTSWSSRPGRTRSRCSAADFVTTEDGTGVVHLAPGLRRGRPERLQRGRHPDRGHRRRPHPVHRAGARRTRACRSSRRTSRSSATSRSAAWCCGTTPTRTRTRTAGAATPRWSTRRCRRGSSR